MKSIYKRATLAICVTASLSLTACGGSDSNNEVINKIEEEYDRIEDQVSNLSDDIVEDYKALEDKLTSDEKETAEIIESIFLPTGGKEKLDEFLDKITPEGGKGGLYVGHFIDVNDGNNDDIDIGSIYFDIAKDFGGSVEGRISYQQQPCQDNKTLATGSAVKVNDLVVGKFSGSLDTLKNLDIKYIRDLDIETPNMLTTFNGQFAENQAGSPWSGRFEYQDGLGNKTLSSGQDNCDVTYTLSPQADYTTYPLSYELGSLNVQLTGNGSTTSLSWTQPENAAVVLVSQLNVNDVNKGANGYARNQIFTNAERYFMPVMTEVSTNYAFVVQAFDKNNQLIAFDAMIADLPAAN